MVDPERAQLLGRVAQLYYEQSVTQEAIAASLHISRPTVSRLLKEAREEGIVQIIINTPFRYVTDLEVRLAQAFRHLQQVQVLRETDSATVVRAAALYVGNIVKDGDVIGVSWGNTMTEMTAHLPHHPLRGATVVQLNGGVARAGAGTNAHDIISRFGRAFGAETYYLNVPAIVDSPQVREALLQNRETVQVLSLGKRATVAVYAIGAPESQSVLVQAGYFSPQFLQRLQRQGAAGDICSRYFTVDGQVCDSELNARTIGVTLEALGQVEHAVAVVRGAHKAPGVLGALRGGFLTDLIIDEATAGAVLRLHEGEANHP